MADMTWSSDRVTHRALAEPAPTRRYATAAPSPPRNDLRLAW